jgi:hypothetical protein
MAPASSARLLGALQDAVHIASGASEQAQLEGEAAFLWRRQRSGNSRPST